MGYKLHIGCGGKPLDGFVNIDPFYVNNDYVPLRREFGADFSRRSPPVRRGDAANTGMADKSCSLVFSNAVFEHLFFGHHLAVLAEWARILTKDGLICTLGIPDFAAIAKLYVDKAQGITGDTFDLFEAYRYCHGWAEGDTEEAAFTTWDVQDNPDAAPPGWLPQAHKAIFDADYLNDLLHTAGLPATVFTYSYPGEPPLNLGFLAAHTQPSIDMLDAIPNIEQWVEDGTTIPCPPSHQPTRMTQFTQWAGTGTWPTNPPTG